MYVHFTFLLQPCLAHGFDAVTLQTGILTACWAIISAASYVSFQYTFVASQKQIIVFDCRLHWYVQRIWCGARTSNNSIFLTLQNNNISITAIAAQTSLYANVLLAARVYVSSVIDDFSDDIDTMQSIVDHIRELQEMGWEKPVHVSTAPR